MSATEPPPPASPTEPVPGYALITCQVGCEPALKRIMAREWPTARFSYSRPGFITYKFPTIAEVERFVREPRNPFVRFSSVCLGKVQGDDAGQLREAAMEWIGDKTWKHLHCFEKDSRATADGFEPGITPLAESVAEHWLEAWPQDKRPKTNQVAGVDEQVLDCVIVQPGEWWVGYHVAATPAARWPGGIPLLRLPSEMVSRAYVKLEEALRWSKLPLRKGDLCVEIGSAPGGASQALLDHGAHVIGIDPAEMDERVMEHPHFQHLRKRSKDVKKKLLKDARWLIADCNVAPQYTLDSVEDIVTNQSVHVRGLILTLKLTNWDLADSLQAICREVQSWGYRYTRVRQLAHNRREVCLAALRSRAQRRKPQRPQGTNKPQTKDDSSTS